MAGRAAGSASHQDAPASDPTAGTGTPGDRLPTARCSPGRNPAEPGLLLAFCPRRSRASSSASGGPDPVRGSAGACRGIPRPVLCRCTQVMEIWELSTQQSGQSPSLQREERARCAPSEPCPSCCSQYKNPPDPEMCRNPRRKKGLFGSMSQQPGRRIPLPSPAVHGVVSWGRLSNNFLANLGLLRAYGRAAAPRELHLGDVCHRTWLFPPRREDLATVLLRPHGRH